MPCTIQVTSLRKSSEPAGAQTDTHTLQKQWFGGGGLTTSGCSVAISTSIGYITLHGPHLHAGQALLNLCERSRNKMKRARFQRQRGVHRTVFRAIREDRLSDHFGTYCKLAPS